MMNAIKQPCCFYGYDEYGFVLAKADGSDYQNIMDKDSLYVRMLKFYFNANQMGLVDPDSLNQSYADCFEKYVNGQILFSPWPWLGQSAYNTIENAQKCKGFMVAPIEDMQIFSYGCNPNGRHECVIAVGSQAKDPQRLADFIDWLYSDEGICVNGASLSGATAGPEGLAWEMKEDGPYLTEFGIEALYNGGSIEVPKEYGGGTWVDGSSALNYKTVALTEKNKDGYYYYYSLWDSVKELNKNALTDDWSEDVWEEDMRLLKLAHVDIVTLNVFNWAMLQKDDDVYDFTKLDKVMRMVKENGLKVCMATSTAAHPAWMARKHPDILRTEHNGIKRKFGSRHNSCPNSPTYRKYSVLLASKIAQQYKDYDNIVAWHVANEYGGQCYCENCEKQFRVWLKEKYKTIEELNRVWNLAFWGHTMYD